MYLRALLVLCAFGTVLADEKPCTLHHHGKFYDLNPLKASKDYELKTPGDHLFAINVCRNIVHETFGLKEVDSADVGGIVRRDHGDFSIGTFNTTLTVEDSRPRITMTKGSRCKPKSSDEAIRGSSVIEFVCDTSVSGNGKPRLVAQLPPGDDEEACAFFIEWRTSVACPTSEPGGVWSILWYLIVTLIALGLLYLAAGTLYNRYVLQLRGVDQIPQFSYESMKYHASEAIDWLQDLAGNMRSGGAYNRTSSTSYHSDLPTHRPSSRFNPVSHQSQSQTAQDGPGDGSFIRPQPRGVPTAGRINPISHQAQTAATTEAPLPPVSAHPMGPPAPPPKNLKPQPESQSTPEESDFELGDDDDDEAEGYSDQPQLTASSQGGSALGR